MTWWLRTLAALPGNPSFTPSTQTICNSSSSGSDTFFWHLRALNTDGAWTYVQAKHLYTYGKNKGYIFKERLRTIWLKVFYCLTSAILFGSSTCKMHILYKQNKRVQQCLITFDFPYSPLASLGLLVRSDTVCTNKTLHFIRDRLGSQHINTMC